MKIAPDLLELIVEHARREAPNECCGLIAIDGDEAVDVYEGVNTEASPFRFVIDSATLLKTTDIEDAGQRIGIYHSHTRSEPFPSQTDISQAANWPDAEWLIVGLAGEEPVVRSFTIDGPAVTEVGL
ncbi:MAG TPA: M67 family metallopeptidase [Baekduia sp.]|nr:M67 family metallopeptidase [Baekduia sp.]